ncbi:MAG: glycosyltransferase [Candidatus Ryanbacteria bacterium CG10_big_fil_rev_8_21_14_0_10_43_42]|uniref:Glycosyltransferase n=1 Tax=Candidatus Ryanbacteria bacterium CG10_big_fil_rev_8_21_14_0_10_43_42 TaxID=1974864 RepID=A0A2M8KXK1_9BACT|nr:MAG: glycosyltransferase [Candidatus Ryanbacteria bacterium CG10_big_fil_rev_8_21_14_0_10_43_42]
MSQYLTHKRISVVIACYNESENILAMHERLCRAFEYITPNREIIYVDNASIDNSMELYKKLCEKDAMVSVILMARNFGNSDTSYTAGTEYASGDAVVWIDGDIQDPPELIPEFTKKWLEGYDVVYGVRSKRKVGFFLGKAYNAFYKLFNRYSYIKMPLYAGDFCLIDRKIATILNSFPERDRFLRGLRAWVGFRQTGIEYIREERTGGRTTQNLGRYFYAAKKGIISFSYAPLTLISNIALVAMALSLVALLAFPLLAIFYPAPRGFLTLLVTVLFLGSVQFFILAILGEYLGRVFEEVKQRPRYIIREILNNRQVQSK